jgi:hypothetical protein
MEFKRIAYEQLNFEADQMKIAEYYIDHKNELTDLISAKLSKN